MNQRSRQIPAHTHTGARIGATATELYILQCRVCGLKYAEGTEDLSPEDRAVFNEAFAPELRED
jgi:hypothetical protein